jgi:hypothetical protein
MRIEGGRASGFGFRVPGLGFRCKEYGYLAQGLKVAGTDGSCTGRYCDDATYANSDSPFTELMRLAPSGTLVGPAGCVEADGECTFVVGGLQPDGYFSALPLILAPGIFPFSPSLFFFGLEPRVE